MKRHLVTLVLAVLLATAAFAQGGAIWNFSNMPGPYGPPILGAANTLPTTGLVNRIDTPLGEYQDVSFVSGEFTTLGGTLAVCIYQDLESAPVWQATYTPAKTGLFTMNPGITAEMTGTWYFFYTATGGSVQGFQTSQYPWVVEVADAIDVYWGTASNYQKGMGAVCPGSLGGLKALPANGQPSLAALQIHP
jgi:hypothetical protein